ncbi:MAG: lytic transglycosylase domain-containing protein, partial [Alphaproteobacteria bacterium]|nr:lytic transglycosylase domain-containing protein [Alphaproteobacteria bacterium]
IHAIVRQESLFQRDAVSSAGARGYMQLMPATAKQVAKQLGIKKFRTSDLSDPQINLRLGSAYLDKRIDDLGSLPLAIASYNAGIGNVRDWLETLGDPRQGSIDMIDWIEMIPVAETRNYVQRVLENLQVYRARLAGGQAPLRVLHDLK